MGFSLSLAQDLANRTGNNVVVYTFGDKNHIVAKNDAVIPDDATDVSWVIPTDYKPEPPRDPRLGRPTFTIF